MRRLSSLFCLLLAAGCGSDIDADQTATDTQEAPAAIADSPVATGLLRSLRARTTAALQARSAASSSDVSLPTALSPEAPLAALLLPEARLRSFVRASDGLVPLSDASAVPAVKLVLPEAYSGEVRLEDAKSSLGFEVRVQDARAVGAELAEGYLVYRENLGPGTTGFYRATEGGFEDYVLFEQAPSQPEVKYALRLNDSVAGLRLVSNTLELVDSAGAPRLRVAPPFLIGADGARSEATLNLQDCQADTDPAPPWGRAVTQPGARDCSLVVRWSNADLAYPAVLDPAWSSTADMATLRAQHTASTLSTGRVLVTGGLTTGGSVVASAELFDPTTGTWSATQAMSTPRYLHTATGVSTNEVVVLGGYSSLNANPGSSAQRYNPQTGVWATAGTPGTARAAHAATRLDDGGILVTGGFNASGAALTSAQRYNAATRVWSSAAAFSGARGLHTSTLMTGGTVLIAGGKTTSSGTSALATAFLYRPSSNQWANAGSLIAARYNHSAQTIQVGGTQKLWLAGGQSTTGVALPSTEVYVQGSPGTWTRSANLTYPRRNHSANLVGGRVVVTGGIGLDNAPVLVSEVLNPAYEVIAETPSASIPRAYHAAAVLSNSRLLVSGGSSAASLAASSPLFRSAEILDATFPAVTTSDYKELGVFVPEIVIFDGSPVDIWARHYRPTTPTPGVTYPVVLFLHGNHGTCGRGSNPRIDDSNDYTYTGECPAGYSVVDNHLGYEYAARELASRGYYVVSINANRGITQGDGPDSPDRPDPALIRARGNLVLKHLEYLSAWNRSSSANALGPYRGLLDFSHVGLMGHSRGGEGVRAAVELYRRVGSPWPARIGTLRFKALLEIAPTDGLFWEWSTPDEGEHPAYLTAQDMKWAVILPMCDGDIHRLDGIRPFDRMLGLEETGTPSMKASYTVWGANHNYFNTEWQQSDSTGCLDHRALFSTAAGVSGSAEQRQVSFHALLKFFTASLGDHAEPSQAGTFIPGRWAPPEPRIERGFTPTTSVFSSQALEDFSGAPGFSRAGIAYQRSSNVAVAQVVVPEHDADHRGGLVTWSSGSSGSFLQINWSAAGAGLSLAEHQNFSLRVGRARDTARNTGTTTRFSVQLVGSNGALSAAQNIEASVSLLGPVGSNDVVGSEAVPLYHSMLQTAHLNMSAFTGIDISQVRGVRFVFNQSTTGAVYLADIAANSLLTRDLWFGGGVGPAGEDPAFSAAAPSPARAARGPAAPVPAPLPSRAPTINTGNSVRSVSTAGSQAELVEVALSTTTRVPFRNAALRIAVGDLVTSHVRFGGPDRGALVFRLTRAQFDQLGPQQPIRLYFGDGSSGPIWSFGALNKAALK